MVLRARPLGAGDQGFTLIELLVVILIIGVLAAIAIPSFLSQKTKATAAQAKELARTAETTAETYATDHNGNYAGITAGALHEYEGSIVTAEPVAKNEAWLSNAEELEAGKGYSVTATAPGGVTFTVEKEPKTSAVNRTCLPVKIGTGCPTGNW